MSATLKRRLAHLEEKRGDPLDAYLESLSDEELEAQIAKVDAQLREMAIALGIDCIGLTSEQVMKALQDAETAGAA